MKKNKKTDKTIKDTIINILKTINNKLITFGKFISEKLKVIISKLRSSNNNEDETNTTVDSPVSIELDENGEIKPILQDFTGNAKDVFSTNKQKYENTMSSAVILLTFGIVGLFIEFLDIVGLIYLPFLTFQYVLMFLVFMFFLMSGIFSYRKANSYKVGMDEEDKQRSNVDYFLNDLLTDQVLKELKSDELTEEENYVLIIDKLSAMILEKYPKYNKDLLEYMIDDYLNEHF